MKQHNINMLDSIEVLAGIGAILSMVSNVPQVWKVRHRHSTGDLHVYTAIMHFMAAVLWSTYGFLLELYILGIESGIVGLLNFCILLAIYRDYRLTKLSINTSNNNIKC